MRVCLCFYPFALLFVLSFSSLVLSCPAFVLLSCFVSWLASFLALLVFGGFSFSLSVCLFFNYGYKDTTVFLYFQFFFNFFIQNVLGMILQAFFRAGGNYRL